MTSISFSKLILELENNSEAVGNSNEDSFLSIILILAATLYALDVYLKYMKAITIKSIEAPTKYFQK